jgi:hypothetical protein
VNPHAIVESARSRVLTATAPVLVAFVLGLWSGVGHAADMEQRCADLGNDCVCSETLDWDGDAGFGPGLINPPNSVSRQCNGGGSIDLANQQHTVSARSVGLDWSGNVLQIRSHEAGNMVDSNRDFTNGTYCVREYVRFSSGFPAVQNSDQNIKGPRNNKPVGAPHPGFETGWKPGGGPLEFAPQGNHGTPFGSTAREADLSRTAGQDVDFQDCKDSWCRIEYCFDHNSDGTRRLRFRGRITQVSTGRYGQYGPEVSVGSSPTAQSGSNSFPVHFFSNNIEGGHYRYHSHVMVAIREPADPGFWIGAASEIESGAAEPAPPPISPPAPPTLLE